MFSSRNVLLTLALVASVVACHGDFLAGGELSNDPNRPTAATNSQLFVGVQSNIFYFENGEVTRFANLFSQHLAGADRYVAIGKYAITEGTTNGAQRMLYGPGGLLDVRRLQAGAAAAGDSLFVGIAQVQEAMLMAYNADVFGDVVYSQALGAANPALDPQLTVFDSIQVVLSRAIASMAASGVTNIGPRTADLVYAGDRTKWTALAHTLKARYYMHTAEVPARSASAYDSAKVEAAQGISASANNYTAVYSGAPGETNPWRNVISPSNIQQPQIAINVRFADTMMLASDPRRIDYFTLNGAGHATGLSAARLAANYRQQIATAAENLLIWAEASYRRGDEVTARAKLDAERALFSIPAEPFLTGNALLAEILTEKSIVDFQLGVEGWKDYRRTCFPNLPLPTGALGPMPGRLFYDKDDRQTNINIPTPGTSPNGIRNQVDPANATADAVGGVCIAGA